MPIKWIIPSEESIALHETCAANEVTVFWSLWYSNMAQSMRSMRELGLTYSE